MHKLLIEGGSVVIFFRFFFFMFIVQVQTFCLFCKKNLKKDVKQIGKKQKELKSLLFTDEWH